MAASAESSPQTFLVSIVDKHLRLSVRKSFLGRRYLLEGDLRFRVGLLSFIDGGVIGYLLRGEPNILRVLATGDPKGPGTIPVETLSDVFLEALCGQASDVTVRLSHPPSFSSLYIVPMVVSEVGDIAMAASDRTIKRGAMQRSVEEFDLSLRQRLNRARVTDLQVATAFGIAECLRGVAVGYHKADVFESCWSGSFLTGDATQPDIAEFPGGWSLSVPTNWNGLILSERGRIIAADILAWAQTTDPPKLSETDLEKIQVQT